MASSPEYPSSPEEARMEIDLDAQSPTAAPAVDGAANDDNENSNHQHIDRYSPTTPTDDYDEENLFASKSENHSGVENNGRYSPTNPTDDVEDETADDGGDGLESEHQGQATEEAKDAEDSNASVDEDSSHKQEGNVDDNEHRNDSDNDNQVSVGDKLVTEEEGGSDSNSQEVTSTQNSQFEITETFLDNLNPVQEESDSEEGQAGDGENTVEQQQEGEEAAGKDEEMGMEGERSAASSPEPAAASPPAQAEDSQDGESQSDVLQLSADNDSESKDAEADTSHQHDAKEDDGDNDTCDDAPDSSCIANDVDDHSNDGAEDTKIAADVSEDVREDEDRDDEEISRDSVNSDENVTRNSELDSRAVEDSIDIMETSVDLDEKEEVSENKPTETKPLGVTRVITRESSERGEGDSGDSRTVQTKESETAAYDSEDDVQIIELPPTEPDTLIVDDDDDEDEVVAQGPKVPISELPRIPKKKRTVEQDGADLRIVIREEGRDREREDSRRRRRRRDRDSQGRGDYDRRSDTDRRSDSDRRSSDRSSRRRHHRSRSHSRERRRSKRSRSRSRSRDRSRRRHHRSREREASPEKERSSSHKKRRRDRSRERRSRRSRSRSRSPKHQVEQESWNKENRSEERSERSRDDKSDHEVSENSRRKGRHYRRHSDMKHEESPPVASSSRKPMSSWSPSDTFQKDPSETPPSRSPALEIDEDAHEDEEEVEEEVRDEREVEVVEESPGKMEVQEATLATEDIPIPELEEPPEPKEAEQAEPQPPAEPAPAVVPEPPAMPEPPTLPEPPAIPEPPAESEPPAVPEEEPEGMAIPEPALAMPPPPPLPHKGDGLLPTPGSGQGLLPTPVRLRVPDGEEMVYDPARPTVSEEELEREAIFQEHHGQPHPHPDLHPDLLGGPGQLLGDSAFVVPGEGGLLQTGPQRLQLPSVTFGPHRHLLVNPVLMNRPPFSSSPFSSQLSAPPLPPQFRWQVGGPGVIPLQNQFGQRLPPGPPPPPGGFPGQVNGGIESMQSEGPPQGMNQFAGRPGMTELQGMQGHQGPPGSMQILRHPLQGPPRLQHPSDMSRAEMDMQEDKFDHPLADFVAAQMKEKPGGSLDRDMSRGGKPPPGVFKVPLPPGPPGRGSAKSRMMSGPSMMMSQEPEDSTEVVDMDMSPLDDDCELELPTPPDAADISAAFDEAGKNSKPLSAINLKALSNAIKRLTSQAADDVPGSAVDLTNKEKYLKKLHLQERVVDEVKQAIRPFYSHKKITKEEYKEILRKAVPKVCHSKSGDINPQKIQQLVEAYVAKFKKRRHHPKDKEKSSSKDKLKANGERAKPPR